MGDLGAIVRLGLWDLFEECDDLVTEEASTASLIDRVVEVVPDVVLLDLDADGSDQLARSISAGYPAVTVVACSSERPNMRVYPAFHRGESYVAPLEFDALIDVVRNNR
jgi:DNA-binding NarL/FixJ family response regulator